jgi:hypothetical protein
MVQLAIIQLVAGNGTAHIHSNIELYPGPVLPTIHLTMWQQSPSVQYANIKPCHWSQF